MLSCQRCFRRLRITLCVLPVVVSFVPVTKLEWLQAWSEANKDLWELSSPRVTNSNYVNDGQTLLHINLPPPFSSSSSSIWQMSFQGEGFLATHASQGWYPALSLTRRYLLRWLLQHIAGANNLQRRRPKFDQNVNSTNSRFVLAGLLYSQNCRLLSRCLFLLLSFYLRSFLNSLSIPFPKSLTYVNEHQR